MKKTPFKELTLVMLPLLAAQFARRPAGGWGAMDDGHNKASHKPMQSKIEPKSSVGAPVNRPHVAQAWMHEPRAIAGRGRLHQLVKKLGAYNNLSC